MTTCQHAWTYTATPTGPEYARRGCVWQPVQRSRTCQTCGHEDQETVNVRLAGHPQETWWGRLLAHLP